MTATTQGTPPSAGDTASSRLAHLLPGTDQGSQPDADLVWQELDSFYSWYSRAATRTRVAYQGLKVTSLLLAAVVTVLAASGAPSLLTACTGAAIVVVEGIQQLFKFHTNWLRYRVVTETLREHGLLYVARLTPYDGDSVDARARLGDLMRSVIEDERRQWAVQMKPSEAGSR